MPYILVGNLSMKKPFRRWLKSGGKFRASINWLSCSMVSSNISLQLDSLVKRFVNLPVLQAKNAHPCVLFEMFEETTKQLSPWIPEHESIWFVDEAC
jgi:hypothetical protein